jgi:hypothetical protein
MVLTTIKNKSGEPIGVEHQYYESEREPDDDREDNPELEKFIVSEKKKPYFISAPYDAPRELQPTGKFRRTYYDDLDTIAQLMFGKSYKNLTPAQQERARVENKKIYPDRNVLISPKNKLKKVV